MHTRYTFSFFALLLSMFAAPIAHSDTHPVLRKKALEFIGYIRENKSDKAYAMMHPKMQEAMPVEGLRTFWTMMQLRLGTFQRTAEIRTAPFKKFIFVLVTCEFTNQNIIWRLVFDDKQRVAGMQFLPAKRNPKARPKPTRTPPYAQPKLFTENPLQLHPKWKLKAVLSLPKQAAKVPAVILVHGSGPQDQDETIGPNKVFRDIAWGLASRGIAVLRYQKRTHKLGEIIKKLKGKQQQAQIKAMQNQIDLDFEVINDATLAIDLLSRHPNIDARRIFVIGHSLGAMMAPSIAQRSPKVAGIVMLGSPSRSLEDVVLDQIFHLVTLDGKLSPAETKQLKQTIAQFILIKTGQLNDTTPPSMRLLGMSRTYLDSLQYHAPTRWLPRIKQPVLLLQADRDYQVTQVDYKGWQARLKGRPHTTMKHYPALNHLFMEGKGLSGPKEYLNPSHVAARVILDIAQWIQAQPAVQTPTSRPVPKTPLAIGRRFLETYIQALLQGDPQKISRLYLDSPHTTSISSRGDITKGFANIQTIYQNATHEAKFVHATSHSIQARPFGDGLLLHTKFSFTIKLKKNPPQHLLYRSQATLLLKHAKGKWLIAHEHFSPIVGVPRVQRID